jgi:hypothetical protein
MKYIRTFGTIIFFLLLNGLTIKAQPIPVELMVGHKYGTVNLSFSRNFSQNSRFGLTANIDEYEPDPSVESNFGVFIRKEIF